MRKDIYGQLPIPGRFGRKPPKTPMPDRKPQPIAKPKPYAQSSGAKPTLSKPMTGPMVRGAIPTQAGASSGVGRLQKAQNITSGPVKDIPKPSAGSPRRRGLPIRVRR